MANEKSDKGLVAILVTACTVVILIFHFAWAKYLLMNYSRPVFAVVDVILALLFAWVSVKAYNHADDPNKDGLRWWIAIIAVASCVWAAAWSTGLMNDLSQGL